MSPSQSQSFEQVGLVALTPTSAVSGTLSLSFSMVSYSSIKCDYTRLHLPPTLTHAYIKGGVFVIYEIRSKCNLCLNMITHAYAFRLHSHMPILRAEFASFMKSEVNVI